MLNQYVLACCRAVGFCSQSHILKDFVDFPEASGLRGQRLHDCLVTNSPFPAIFLLQQFSERAHSGARWSFCFTYASSLRAFGASCRCKCRTYWFSGRLYCTAGVIWMGWQVYIFYPRSLNLFNTDGLQVADFCSGYCCWRAD